jgi:hypothetical protein
MDATFLNRVSREVSRLEPLAPWAARLDCSGAGNILAKLLRGVLRLSRLDFPKKGGKVPGWGTFPAMFAAGTKIPISGQ